MRRLAWLNVVVGVLAIAIGVARLLTSADDAAVTVEYFLAVGLALTTSGIALVGASWNLRLSALRAELQLQGSGSQAP